MIRNAPISVRNNNLQNSFLFYFSFKCQWPDINAFFPKWLLGETKLIFWSTGKTAKKVGWVGRQNKNNIFLGLVFLKNILHSKHRKKSRNL